MFDHIFTILGLSRESSIHHPIVLTEPPCNPGYCQNGMCVCVCVRERERERERVILSLLLI